MDLKKVFPVGRAVLKKNKIADARKRAAAAVLEDKRKIQEALKAVKLPADIQEIIEQASSAKDAYAVYKKSLATRQELEGKIIKESLLKERAFLKREKRRLQTEGSDREKAIKKTISEIKDRIMGFKGLETDLFKKYKGLNVEEVGKLYSIYKK